ncbi:hypothetical protein [Paenibacillus anseongense]|uniref:hypothetical protein n=1 Tax=Paenibacillus TaxID=44249 RepID=UPI002DBF9011|nr:hypothetical protein [Paenibacillus anseongense]MEC0266918.1 hypothetical protein [Paenibacillus anseongense]
MSCMGMIAWQARDEKLYYVQEVWCETGVSKRVTVFPTVNNCKLVRNWETCRNLLHLLQDLSGLGLVGIYLMYRIHQLGTSTDELGKAHC